MASKLSVLVSPFKWFWHLSWIKRILIVLIIVGLGFWYWSSKNKSLAVQTTQAHYGELTESVSASGEVEALERADLAFQVGGRLAWVGVKEGDTVRKGQAIAYLDKAQLQATLKKYLNAYERERTEFDDTSDSADDVTIDDAVARIKKRAQVDLDQTVIDVEIQNESIRLSHLYTPIAGVVTKAEPIYAGVNVGPTTAGYQIVNPETVYFEAEVNEIDITKIHAQTPVEIELDAYPSEILKESIYDISFASRQTSTGGTAYTVKITLPENSNFKYRLGMNGDARFVLSKKENVLLVPQTAIVETDDKTYLWTVDAENTAHKIEVKTGISSVNDVEIVSGITEGQKVIIRPPVELTEGTKIK